MSNKQKITIKNASNSAKEDMSISLIGPPGCGKSAILVKYITRRFIGEYDPYFEGCFIKTEKIDGLDINVHVLDTYDKEKKNLEKYIKWSDAIIIVYSITNSESFMEIYEYIDSIISIIKKINDESNNKNEKSIYARIILLGNKIDMEHYRQVTRDDVSSLLARYSSYMSRNNLAENNEKDPEFNNSQSYQFFDIMHLETTACDEYQLIENTFHRILRDIKKDRQLLNECYNMNHQDIFFQTSILSSKSILKQINPKRSKSPKLNSINLIHQTSTLPDTNNNNASSNTLSPIEISCNNSIKNSTLYVSNSHSRNSSPNFSNREFSNINTANKDAIQNNSNSSGLTKKNSSKFPFFNKILNKSS